MVQPECCGIYPPYYSMEYSVVWCSANINTNTGRHPNLSDRQMGAHSTGVLSMWFLLGKALVKMVIITDMSGFKCRFTTVDADVLAPMWCQDICNHNGDVNWDKWFWSECYKLDVTCMNKFLIVVRAVLAKSSWQGIYSQNDGMNWWSKCCSLYGEPVFGSSPKNPFHI